MFEQISSMLKKKTPPNPDNFRLNIGYMFNVILSLPSGETQSLHIFQLQAVDKNRLSTVELKW